MFLLEANEDWWGRYEKEIGAEQLLRYKHKVYWMLFRIKKGASYKIDNIPEKERELFVKIACQFLMDFQDRKKRDPDFMPDEYFDFDANVTLIRHI